MGRNISPKTEIVYLAFCITLFLHTLKQSLNKQTEKINIVEFKIQCNCVCDGFSHLRHAGKVQESKFTKGIGQRLKKLCQCQTAVPNAGILLKYLQSCPNKRVKKFMNNDEK